MGAFDIIRNTEESKKAAALRCNVELRARMKRRTGSWDVVLPVDRTYGTISNSMANYSGSYSGRKPCAVVIPEGRCESPKS